MKTDAEALRGQVRLLQFLLSGPARPETSGATPAEIAGLPGSSRQRQGRGELLLVSTASGRALRCRKPLLALCARQGLAELSDGAWHLLPPARSALRRLLAGPDLAFVAQHGGLDHEERLVGTERQPVLVNRHSSPLAQLARMKDRDGADWFPPEAIRAGERLLADFTYGGLQPRVTSSLQPRISARSSGGAGAGEMRDSVADARARVSRAAQALGPELAGVALDVCCFEKGLERVEKERHWPARSAKLMLRAALLALARHYGEGVRRAAPIPREYG